MIHVAVRGVVIGTESHPQFSETEDARMAKADLDHDAFIRRGKYPRIAITTDYEEVLKDSRSTRSDRQASCDTLCVRPQSAGARQTCAHRETYGGVCRRSRKLN